MSFLPPMTGNGLYIPPIEMVIWGMVDYCFTHMIYFVWSILIHILLFVLRNRQFPSRTSLRRTLQSVSSCWCLYVLNCCCMFYVALVFCGAIWTCSPVTTFFLRHDSPVRPKWMPTQPSPKLHPILQEPSASKMSAICTWCFQSPANSGPKTFPKPTWRYQPATSLIQQHNNT